MKLRVKLKYIPKALKSQMPIKRFIRNFFITRNAWGMFSKRAHFKYNGDEKVSYNTFETAKKSANSMEKKYGNVFSAYFCPFCGKYHLGKNRNDRLRDYEVICTGEKGSSFCVVVKANNEDHAVALVKNSYNFNCVFYSAYMVKE